MRQNKLPEFDDSIGSAEWRIENLKIVYKWIFTNLVILQIRPIQILLVILVALQLNIN